MIIISLPEKKIVLLAKEEEEEENSEALNSIHLFTYALQIELKREKKSRVVKQRAKNKQKKSLRKNENKFIDFLINILW